MLLFYSLLVLSCESAAISTPLKLTATPDYPVASGQSVNLHCSSSAMLAQVSWYWERLQNQTWHVVGVGQELTLTEPEQSGLYRCLTDSPSSHLLSTNHTVSITSMHVTVGEKLGIAAFAFSLLALAVILADLLCRALQRHGDTVTTPSTGAKGFPGDDKAPKGGTPQSNGSRDVYMNYTSTSEAYTNLDPSSMTADNLYSILS